MARLFDVAAKSPQQLVYYDPGVGTIGAPAAILNAINDALAPLGAEVDAIPATPRRIHAALQAAGARGGCA